MLKKTVAAMCILITAAFLGVFLFRDAHAAGDVPINQTYFPDGNFRAWVSTNCDTNKDGILSETEANIWGEIHVEGLGIASMKGIEYFPSLIKFHCGNNKLTSLDMSRNTNLFHLECGSNRLTKLTLSDNPLMKYLSCSGNRLTSLDLSACPDLETLYCSENNFTVLDLSNYVNLVYVICGNTPLTELRLPHSAKLSSLYCYNCRLTALDVSHNPSLTYLECSLSPLTELDLTHNPALETLYCMNQELTALNISKCTALQGINCSNNKITKLDLSKNTALQWISCGNNHLKSLDCSKNTALETLNCSGNQITSLNLSKNTALDYLNCENNRLTSLDLSKNPVLNDLDCGENLLTSLDLSKNKNLEVLYCAENRLSTLDISSNTKLYRLRCENNRLKELTIHKNDEIRDLHCEGNMLSSIDIRQCSSLQLEFKIRTTESIDNIVYLGRTYNGEQYDWSISYDKGVSFIGYPSPTLSASVTSSQVKLKWVEIEDAEEYEIYRKVGSGTSKRIKTVKTLSYTDQNAPGGYVTYSVRAKGGQVTGLFAEKTVPVNPFTDVSEADSYFSSVMWAVGNGIVTGTTSVTFSPKAPCKRYQFAVMLYRLAGKPVVSGAALPFTDIPADASYYNAVAWAYGSKIISGTSAATFSPDNTVTRYQAVAMLYKMAGRPAVSGTNPFTDVSSDASYYKAVLWAVEKGITKGTSATTFSPMADCQRYQMAAFLNRFNSVYKYK